MGKGRGFVDCPHCGWRGRPQKCPHTVSEMTASARPCGSATHAPVHTDTHARSSTEVHPRAHLRGLCTPPTPHGWPFLNMLSWEKRQLGRLLQLPRYGLITQRGPRWGSQGRAGRIQVSESPPLGIPACPHLGNGLATGTATEGSEASRSAGHPKPVPEFLLYLQNENMLLSAFPEGSI